MPEQEYDTSVPEVEAPAVEVATPEVATPEAGQVEAAEPEVGTPMPTFTVTVDGEQFEVTAEEAINGYQRHADYTRKTQEVASERQSLASEREQLSRAQQLWDAIESNPESTIQAIAQAYGFSLTPAEQAAAAQQRSGKAEDPFADLYDDETPEGKNEDPRLARIEQFMQDQEQRAQTAAIENELLEVRSRYGVNVDGQALIEYAVENNIGSLDAAFRAMAFDAAQQAAVRQRKAGRKQGLPPVAGGHSVQAGVLVPGAGSAHPTLDEAYAAALAEHEG